MNSMTVTVPAGEKSIEMQGNGPVTLVVHGGPGMDYSYMKKGLEDLSANYTLAFYEQTPLRHEVSERTSAGDQVAELSTLIHSLASRYGGPIRLIGHSWGTYLALELFHNNHPAVSHLALLNPLPLTWERLLAAGDRLGSRVRAEHLEQVERLEADGTEDSGVRLMRLVSYAYLAPANAELEPFFERYNPAVNAEVLASVEHYDQTDAGSWLNDISVSLVYGDSDHFLPADTAELHKVGHCATITNCGHLPFDEQPGMLVQLLQDALA